MGASRHFILRNFKRFRINAGQLIRSELAEIRYTLGRDHDSVGNRMGRRHFLDFDLAGFRIETSNKVGLLGCKPYISLRVNRRRVRIANAGIGHMIFGDLSGFGIELSNISFEDRSEPYISTPVRYQAVGTGIWRLQREFFEFSGFGIETPQLVCHLSGIPKRAIGSERRVVWPGL